MASGSRAAFLVPSILLLMTLALVLVRMPALAGVVSGIFFLFMLATATVLTREASVLLALAISMIQSVGAALSSGTTQAALMAQVPLFWVAALAVHAFAQRQVELEASSAQLLDDRQAALAALNKEKESLAKRLKELNDQLQLRRSMFDAVQELASLLDPVKIRQRLMEFVRAAIGKGSIQFYAGHVPRDLLDKWVMERRLSLLVTDIAQDARFKMTVPPNEARSVLAAPMIVERQWTGLVRVNGFEPDLFSVADLRVLEALTLMASLALENLQLLARLKEGATRDNLTGLYTHRFFEERLNEELLSAGRFHTGFCLLLMDIDHFKRYNDTYGHAAGDEVLVRFARLLQRLARPVDFVARYGGEEFAILLPQTSADDGRQVAERIRQAIAAETFQFTSDAPGVERVTVSIGVSSFPVEATTSSQLVRVADMRLYQAKQNGRNQVVG